VSFEPVRSNVRFVQRHLRLNHIDNAQMVEAAVGSNDGVTLFEPHPSNAMGKGLRQRQYRRQARLARRAERIARHPDPVVMKIDVEGAELSVLEGATRMLARCRPSIFLATHGQKIHRDRCEFLRNAGYSLRALYESISSIDATDEILATPRDS